MAHDSMYKIYIDYTYMAYDSMYNIYLNVDAVGSQRLTSTTRLDPNINWLTLFAKPFSVLVQLVAWFLTFVIR